MRFENSASLTRRVAGKTDDIIFAHLTTNSYTIEPGAGRSSLTDGRSARAAPELDI